MRGLVSFWVDPVRGGDCRLVAAILRIMVSPAVKVIRELGVGRWGLTRARPGGTGDRGISECGAGGGDGFVLGRGGVAQSVSRM